MSHPGATGIRLWFAGALCFVLFATLHPFAFAFDPGSGTGFFSGILRQFDIRPQQPDIPENITMFVPFGFGMAGLLWPRRRPRVVVPIVWLSGSALSFCLEVLQVFLPSRYSSVSDVVHNGLGAVIGCGIFLRWHPLFFRACAGAGRIWRQRTVARLAGSYAGYAAALLLASFALKRAATLSDWEPDFPLVIGNEYGADRPWHGWLAEVVISDRAAAADEIARLAAGANPAAIFGDALVSHYPLRGATPYADHAGRGPDLVPQGPAQFPGREGHFQTSVESWLETARPAGVINERVARTSQITLGVSVASLDAQQGGPARVVSISGGSDRRNFMLGQEGADLVIRLRTQFADENGRVPEFTVGDFFADSTPRHLAFTYDGAVARVYRDGKLWRESRLYTPEVLSFLLLTNERLDYVELNDAWRIQSRILYYLLFFSPLGPLVWGIWTMPRTRSTTYAVFLIVGTTGLCFATELFLSAANCRPPAAPNFLLGCGIVLIEFLALRVTATTEHQRVLGEMSPASP